MWVSDCKLTIQLAKSQRLKVREDFESLLAESSWRLTKFPYFKCDLNFVSRVKH